MIWFKGVLTERQSKQLSLRHPDTKPTFVTGVGQEQTPQLCTFQDVFLLSPDFNKLQRPQINNQLDGGGY